MTQTMESSLLARRILEIGEALKTVTSTPSVKRLDGDGWKIYRVGRVIRIDVSDEGEE